jgi:hypothetical protein
MDWKGTGAVTTTTVFCAKYDVLFLRSELGRRVIEVSARDVKYSTADRNAASSMSYLVE